MTRLPRSFILAGMAAALAFSVPLTAPSPAVASEIRYVVNGIPVTSFDIQRRAAFLRLQRQGGNLNEKAANEMVDQTLRMAEAKRLGVKVTDQQVDEAYARFASNNKMQVSQLDQIMAQSGVSRAHFKDFIRAQMSWNQALSRRARSGGRMTEQDVVRKMLQKGGQKPSATEFMLQQVVFVVPAAERGKIAARKREAEAMRDRFRSCDTTRQFAKGLIDVTVRDLGRFIEQQLPPDWADDIKKTKAGSATAVRATEKGLEFIGVCSAREVSDDRVAQLVFESESSGSNADADSLSKTYMEELRKKAKIVKR